MTLDCTRCGACCVNPRENEAEGVRAWVEVGPREPLLGRRDLVRKLVVTSEDGQAHLRLDVGGRCLALRGALGRKVSCAIYALRPAGCRRVQAGAPDCLRYRAERGL
ncbi:MAG: YkgJ family cysteine cluster protein [Sandaracinaceae bacterium]|nr:YkgJ family cysteine cluster protein [Sandaracinaceae bacterium]